MLTPMFVKNLYGINQSCCRSRIVSNLVSYVSPASRQAVVLIPAPLAFLNTCTMARLNLIYPYNGWVNLNTCTMARLNFGTWPFT